MFKLIHHHAAIKGLDFQAETSEIGTYGPDEINPARREAMAQLPAGSSDWFTVEREPQMKRTLIVEEAEKIWR